ncbi:MAG: Hsp70 family protein, partial [Anaerolineae bacterium]|nr:Hsp70 family protein [Anaerolineae bacterium]
IIPMGSRYPLRQPVEVMLGAAHEGQTAMEFVIGEIDTEAVGMLEVQYEGGQAVFVAQAERSEQQIIPLNEEAAAKRLAALIPAGVVGEDRVKAVFNVDAQRQLRLTVTDLKTRKVLIDQVAIARLR